jgi:hypothetical protein
MFSRWIVTKNTSPRGTVHCRKTRIPCGDHLLICGQYYIHHHHRHQWRYSPLRPFASSSTSLHSSLSNAFLLHPLTPTVFMSASVSRIHGNLGRPFLLLQYYITFANILFFISGRKFWLLIGTHGAADRVQLEAECGHMQHARGPLV